MAAIFQQTQDLPRAVPAGGLYTSDTDVRPATKWASCWLSCWLVVWNIFFSIYWECHHPNWLIFFRGVETTNQSWICIFTYPTCRCIYPIVYPTNPPKFIQIYSKLSRYQHFFSLFPIHVRGVYIYIYTHTVEFNPIPLGLSTTLKPSVSTAELTYLATENGDV